MNQPENSSTNSMDLSRHHAPLTDRFQGSCGAQTDTLLLSEEQLQSYEENGFVHGVRILSQEQIDLLREELVRFFEPEHEGRELWHEYHTNESDDPGAVLFHALGAWRMAPGFHDLLWHPAFTSAASQLLKGSVRFWHDQLFCKPAMHGGVVAWHQDYSYWTRTKPMAHLTCWIGLDESTKDNGCLHYIPGSHRWDLLPITGLAGDMQSIRKVLSDEQWERFQNPLAIELKAGECSFHHPLMVHGSFANKTETPRRAVVLNVVKDGVRSDADEPLMPGIPVVPTGEKLDGQFFPLLLDIDDSLKA